MIDTINNINQIDMIMNLPAMSSPKYPVTIPQ